ncbi:MAG: PEP-CTERM sorting domain-containing protein [candidate division Zixibacteria bacterium]|nr:PEP-CTERM sorting domain-containing protein [candidate division Zixibacteria bacterium]
MVTYKRQNRIQIYWLVALVVFVLTMTSTWDDVYGVGNPSNVVDTTKTSNGSESLPKGSTNPPYETPGEPVSGVPEPATLILLGSGLSAIYLYGRNRNRLKN